MLTVHLTRFYRHEIVQHRLCYHAGEGNCTISHHEELQDLTAVEAHRPLITAHALVIGAIVRRW